jgi:hypothetical protein
VIYGTAELSDDIEAIIATLEAASQKETTDAGVEAHAVINEDVKRTAPKRILIRVTPNRIISWDHSKLAGTY